jgi:predicted signal transduction protein with EAL and GGDEF domain
MRRTVREFRFCWREQIFEVGVSIGLVPIDADSGDLANVMSGADAACYVAKDSGRNPTIAEWVENRQTLEALTEMGIDYAQGYWLCRPQPLVHDL